jgi:hydroxymethylglutaryl-CoA synthase
VTVKAVGIDAIAFHGPDRYIDMADLAVARGVEPAKYISGLGQTAMAVPTPCEDTVSLAIAAGRKALENFDTDPSEIRTLVVGTETGVDHSKPVATYVHEHLGLASNCRSVETKHACLGGSAGLTAAMDWIAAGRAHGRKALVIAADIARYGLNTPGEPTQGAGAVAFVVSERPRLLEFSQDIYGDYTRQVMDFWRPLYSKYAFTDGHYSINCYLEALAGTWADAASKPNAALQMPIAGLDACFYHVPFVKMAQKAHHRHWEAELGRAVGKDDAALLSQINASFEQRVSPWLKLNATVGNIYTGSLFLALIDYLRNVEVAHEGKTTSVFAYGSGCGASLLFARVARGASAYRRRLDPQPDLNRRRRLDLAAYEEIARASESVDANDGPALDPSAWRLGAGVYYLGTRDHMRQYGR